MLVGKQPLGALPPPSELDCGALAGLTGTSEEKQTNSPCSVLHTKIKKIKTIDEVVAEKAYTFCSASWSWVRNVLLFWVAAVRAPYTESGSWSFPDSSLSLSRSPSLLQVSVGDRAARTPLVALILFC